MDGRNLADSNFYCLVYNLRIPGNTFADLLERVEFETKQRLKADEETIIIYAIGINDSQFVHSKEKHNVPLDKFRENIQKLIDKAKEYSYKIAFLGLTPVDERKTISIPWNPDKSYKNEYIEKYDQAIKKACEENEIYFIEILERLKALNYQDLLEDGLHPNSKGHEKFFEIMRDFLIKNKII